MFKIFYLSILYNMKNTNKKNGQIEIINIDLSVNLTPIIKFFIGALFTSVCIVKLVKK